MHCQSCGSCPRTPSGDITIQDLGLGFRGDVTIQDLGLVGFRGDVTIQDLGLVGFRGDVTIQDLGLVGFRVQDLGFRNTTPTMETQLE